MGSLTSKQAYWGVSILFFLLYFSIVFRNIINIPEYDDYDALLKFLSDFTLKSSFLEKFEILFSQHGEHRILFTRLIVAIGYLITGGINLSVIVAISNLLFIGIGVVFCLLIKRHKDIYIFASSAVFILFNGQNFESSTWSMVGLANIGTLLLAMLSIYLTLQNKKSYFIVGIILSFFTTFSNGNGILLLPTLILAFILQRKKKELIYTIIIFGITIIVYFFNFQKSISNISDIISNLPILIFNFFNFVGCNLWIPSLKIIPFLYGLFIVFTYVFAFFSKLYKKNIIWFALFTFMLLSAAAVAVYRLNPEEMGPLRYRIYGSMFTVLTLMFYFENRESFKIRKLFNFTIIPIGIFSILCTFLYLGKVNNKTENKKASAYSWHCCKNGLMSLDVSKDIKTLEEIENLGFYRMPRIPLKTMVSKVDKTSNKWINPTLSLQSGIDYIKEEEGYIIIRGWAYPENGNMNFTNISAWLLSDGNHIRISTYYERRIDIIFDLNKRECGFFAVIPKSSIPEGSYELGIEMQKKYILPVRNLTGRTNIHINIAERVS
ncbi:MAG: hypothetical protein LBH34_02995, partial [Prevotellaceae bacterium]|nr:hypothetical protein [Prevotellaceae bacterium]